jgi:hypothetical protein
MRARHRVAKLLLRHDLRFEGNNWTQRHLDWPGRVELPEPVAQAVLLDGIGSIDALLVRRESLESRMSALVESSPWERQVAHLRCLRGIDTLSALGLCAEVGDFERFGRPAQLMSYLGLVPSENSSGERRRQGQITKSGSACPAPPGRGGLALPPGAAQGPRAAPSPGGAAPGSLRDLMEGPAASPPQLGPPRLGTRQAPHPLRGRRGEGADRLLLGSGDRRPRPPGTTWSRRRRARPFAPAHPRFSYEQPPRRSRSILDGGRRDETRSCGSQPAHISLTARRAPGRPPPPGPPKARFGGPSVVEDLTNRRPYQLTRLTTFRTP